MTGERDAARDLSGAPDGLAPESETTPPRPTIPVHLVVGDPAILEDPDLRERFLAVLNDEERARHDRFLVERARSEFLLGKAITRLTLARELGCDPRELRFGVAAKNKPTLPHPFAPDLIFNMTHTRGLVALAHARVEGDPDAALGIDAEWIEPGREAAGVAARFFSPYEVQFLKMFSPEAYDRVFFQTWTLKEAYLKARGSGLSAPLRDFWMVFDPKPQHEIRIKGIHIGFAPGMGDDPGAWTFSLMDRGPDHVMALALRSRGGRPAAPAIRTFDPASI